MLNKYYCPNCTQLLTYSNFTQAYECRPCNYKETELTLKKEQSFLNEHSINSDDVYLNEIRENIEALKYFKLDGFYLSSSNAKKDLEKKYNYIQVLIQDTKNLGEHVNYLRSEVNNVRLLIFKKLYEISYVLLNEVYGAYNVKSTPKIINDILSYSNIDELANFLNKSISQIDINSTLNYQIAPKELTKEEKKYQKQKAKELGNSFDRIGDNTIKMLSTNDANRKNDLQSEIIADGVVVALDVGLNLISNAFNSITNSISNRIDILNKVRETDRELNVFMENLYSNFSELDNDVRKLNKILNINYNTLRVLEYSFSNLKSNVFKKLNKNQIFTEYKILKEPLEKNKLFTDLASQIEQQEIYINENFLKFTFKSKKSIFNHLWGAKTYWFFNKNNNTLIDNKDDFKILQSEVTNNINCMGDIYKIKKENDAVFIELDNKIRNLLNNDATYREVQNEVWIYVDKVFYNIKNKIE